MSSVGSHEIRVCTAGRAPTACRTRTALVVAMMLGVWTCIAGVQGEKQSIEPGLNQRDDLIFYGGFEEMTPGDRKWKSAWRVPFAQRLDSLAILSGKEAFIGRRTLRVEYPAGGVGPSQTGVQFPICFERSTGGGTSGYESLHFRYYVRFDEGFDFGLGGKLPGLMGGGAAWKRSGGRLPDGSDGWTLRFMWRREGQAVVYAYLPPGKYQKGDHGFDMPLACRFKPGQWHCLEQYVRLNEIGRADGHLRVWFDGQKVLDLDDIVYRTVDNEAGRIGGIFFSTFHGGSTPEWAPMRTCHARFDGMVAASQPIGTYTGETK